MHKLLDKDGAQHLVDKFLSDQDLQDNKLDEIEEKFDDLYSIVGIEHYGIKIDKNNSDTSARIVYTHDCENYTPARMNYTNGVFEIGSWGNAFFMKNNYPAMCNFYGVEQYKLDPNDHSLKEDGTSSDVADVSYNGNAMSVFDCHIWMKFWEDDNYQYLEVSNAKLDDGFKDYPYVRADGSKADKLYYPMYPGYKDSNNKLRSISGVKASSNTTTAQEVTYASNCGESWSIGDWSHYLWLHSLMLLISKNFNSQVAFGNGNMTGGSSASLKTNGLLNTSGQFFGYSTNSDSMKAFYQENVYANRWQRLLGFYNDKGTYKIKMVPPYTYDETFEGYTTVSSPTVPGSNNYLKDLSFDSSYGLLPKTVGGSATTWVGDYFYTNNAQVDLLLAGGRCGAGAYCGSCSLNVINRATVWDWSIGASPYLTEPVHFDLNTIYGSSPIYFEQDNYAQPLADYTISGNSYQDGTPSPDMPVEVVGVGERTENLFDGYLEIGGLNAGTGADFPNNKRFRSTYIPVKPNTTYTVCTEYGLKPYFNYLMCYDEGKAFLPPYVNTDQPYGRTFTFTTPSSGYYVRLVFSEDAYSSVVVSNPTNYSSDICLVESSIAPSSYVPYGYKLPLTVNGTDTVTTPVYIGAEPLHRIGEYADYVDYASGKILRRIWTATIYDINQVNTRGKDSVNVTKYLPWPYSPIAGTYNANNIRCSTFAPVAMRYEAINGNYISQGLGLQMTLCVTYSTIGATKDTTSSEIKSIINEYLDEHPVKFWYVLAEPIEEDPPVPFPTITPTPGSNTLSIGTTLQPSQVSITGHIKPSSTYGQLLDVNNRAILDKNGDQIFVYGQS